MEVAQASKPVVKRSSFALFGGFACCLGGSSADGSSGEGAAKLESLFRAQDASGKGTLTLAECVQVLRDKLINESGTCPHPQWIMKMLETSGSCDVRYLDLLEWLESGDGERFGAGDIFVHEEEAINRAVDEHVVRCIVAKPPPTAPASASASAAQKSTSLSAFAGAGSNQTRVSERKPGVLQAAGHQNSVLADKDHSKYILKPFDEVEARNYEEIWKAYGEPLQAFVGEYGGILEVGSGAASPKEGEKKRFMRIGNLLENKQNPVVMDCKIGIRTFRESEVANKKPREDLFKKLLQLAPETISDEESRVKACTKHKWMTTRDSVSSTKTLGFRIDGISSKDGVRVKADELQRLKGEDLVLPMLMRVLPTRDRKDPQGCARLRLSLTREIVDKLTELQKVFLQSKYVWSHEIIGASLLFVVDKKGATVSLIDLAKTDPIPDGMKLDHTSPWVPGNHEDGILLGIESMLRLWKRGLEALEDDGASDLVVDTQLEREVTNLESILENHGVNVNSWGGSARSVEELLWELQVEKSVSLELDGHGQLRRSVEIVKAWILVDDPSGATSKVLMDCERSGPLARKLGAGEPWDRGLRRALTELLNIPSERQAELFEVKLESYMYSHEERPGQAKGGFPGLSSLYHIHEVDVRVKDPQSSDLALIGLPAGSTFQTVLNFNPLLGSEVRNWEWAEPSKAGHSRRGTLMGYPRGTKPSARLASSRTLDDDDGPGLKTSRLNTFGLQPTKS